MTEKEIDLTPELQEDAEELSIFEFATKHKGRVEIKESFIKVTVGEYEYFWAYEADYDGWGRDVSLLNLELDENGNVVKGIEH